MESVDLELLPLLLVIGMAFLVPVALGKLKRIYIPVVIGEIIAGIILGKSGFGIIRQSEVLDLLADLGFIFLMFLSGLEISFSGLQINASGSGTQKLRQIIGSHLVLGFLTFLATLALSFALAAVLFHFRWIEDIWIMGLILSTTSLGVVVPVLKEYGTIGERSGQLLLYCALIADFASILLISFYVLIIERGAIADVLLVMILFVVFTMVYRFAALLQRHLPAERFFDEISSATSQIELRGALALVLIFAVLANRLGVEMILGAFLAGVIVSMLTQGGSSTLREKLDALGYGFLIPIFFISVGVDFNLRALLASWSALAVLPVLLLIAFIVKLIPALLFLPFYSLRETLSGGVLLSARLSLIIAASMIGREVGLITEALNSAIILLAIFTCTFAPLIFKWVSPPRPKTRERIIVMGCRNVAALLGKRLYDHGRKITVLCDTDGSRRIGASHGEPSYRNRETVLSQLREAGADLAETVVALEERDEDNLVICRIARSVFNVPNLVSWVQDTTNQSEFTALHARIVNPARSTLLFIEAMVLNSDFYKFIEQIDASLTIREIKLKKSRAAGKRVRDLLLKDNVTIIGISRGGELMVPDNRTRVQTNDTLTLIGSAADISIAIKNLHNGNP